MKIITILNLLFATFLFHLLCIVLLSYSINQSIDYIDWQQTHNEWALNDDTCPNRDLFAESPRTAANLPPVDFDDAAETISLPGKDSSSSEDSWLLVTFAWTGNVQIDGLLPIELGQLEVTLTKGRRTISFTHGEEEKVFKLARDINLIGATDDGKSIIIKGLEPLSSQGSIQLKLELNEQKDLEMDFFKELVLLFDMHNCIYIDNEQFKDKHKDKDCVVLDENWKKHKYTLNHQLKPGVFGVKDVSDHSQKVLKLYKSGKKEGEIAKLFGMDWLELDVIYGKHGILVMTDYGKGNLWHFVTAKGVPDPSDRMGIMEQEIWMMKCEQHIIEQLQKMHEAEYVHGDLKAKNIIIGEKGECIIIDFGLTMTFEEVRQNLDRIISRGSNARPFEARMLSSSTGAGEKDKIRDHLRLFPAIFDEFDLNAIFIKLHARQFPDGLKEKQPLMSSLAYDFEGKQNRQSWFSKFEKALDHNSADYRDLEHEPNTFEEFLVQESWIALNHARSTEYGYLSKYINEETSGLERMKRWFAKKFPVV